MHESSNLEQTSRREVLRPTPGRRPDAFVETVVNMPGRLNERRQLHTRGMFPESVVKAFTSGCADTDRYGHLEQGGNDRWKLRVLNICDES